MLPKEGGTIMDIADSQSKLGFPRYPQTMEVKKAMLNNESATEGCTVE
jgi:hypothetical protein